MTERLLCTKLTRGIKMFQRVQVEMMTLVVCVSREPAVCEHHFHRGLRSSDHCWFVCSSRPSVCCVIVSYTVLSCNRTTHTAASLGAQAHVQAPVPTWRSCQRHGSVPWQPTYHLCGVLHERRTEEWNCANWGASNYCGCPLFGCPGGGKGFHLFNGNLKRDSSGLRMSPRFTTARGCGQSSQTMSS